MQITACQHFIHHVHDERSCQQGTPVKGFRIPDATYTRNTQRQIKNTPGNGIHAIFLKFCKTGRPCLSRAHVCNLGDRLNHSRDSESALGNASRSPSHVIE